MWHKQHTQLEKNVICHSTMRKEIKQLHKKEYKEIKRFGQSYWERPASTLTKAQFKCQRKARSTLGMYTME